MNPTPDASPITSPKEGQIHLAMESAGMGVWDWDIAGGKLSWSSEHYRMLGLTPFSQPPTVELWSERIHPADRASVLERLQRSRETCEDFSALYRVVMEDGSLKWLRGRGRFEYEDGVAVRMHGVLSDETALVAATEAGRIYQERTQLVMDAARMGVFDYDVQTDSLYWSENHFRIFGYDEKFVPTTSHWRQRVHPDDLPWVSKHYNTRLQQDTELQFEYRIILPSGEVRWIENKTRCEVDDQGEIARIYGALSDCTERVHEMQRREEVTQTIDLALDAGHMAVFDYDYEGNEMYWSDGTYRIFGYSEKFKPTFEAWWSRVHPDDRNPVIENNTEAFESRHPLVVEYRVVWPDGSVHWVESRATFDYLPDGQPKRLYGVVIDVDERMRAQEAVAESERRFRMLADSSPLMVYMTNQKFDTVYVNRKWCEYTGAPAEESLDRKWQRFIHPDDSPALLPTMSLPTALRDFRAEYRVRRFDGQYRWCVSEAVARRSADGEFLGHIGSIYDIHEAVLAREELEKRVVERTEQLTAANTELEGFTYTVAHDLRTPLRAITSNSRILLEDFEAELTPDAQDLLHRQARAATQMGTLIDDLLEYSRIGRSSIKKTQCDLAEIAAAVKRDAIAEGSVEPFELVMPEFLKISADPQLMRFVFLNLFSNSVKFREPTRPLVVQVGIDEVDGRRAFFVRDNGVGFEQEYAERIFRPFERLVRADQYPGTGIGLANVARIVRRHGGSVWAKGTPGEGAIFYFTLT